MNYVRLLTIFALTATLAGCTSMKVRGLVTDAKTGKPVETCDIWMGERNTRSSLTGRYTMVARRMTRDGTYSRRLDFRCQGYEPKWVDIDTSWTRHPEVNVTVVPIGRQ